MGKFKGFKPQKSDDLVARAVAALIWLVNRPGGTKVFASWSELYAAITGIDKPDPNDVREHLRRRGGTLIKRKLMDQGFGCISHPADRGMIRATKFGDDSGDHWHPVAQQRFYRASERYRYGVSQTMGDPLETMGANPGQRRVLGLARETFKLARSTTDLYEQLFPEKIKAPAPPKKKKASA